MARQDALASGRDQDFTSSRLRVSPRGTRYSCLELALSTLLISLQLAASEARRGLTADPLWR